MKFRTRQIHAGVEPDPTTGAILTPIHQSTTFVQDSIDEYMARGYSYSRSGNPTVDAFEEKIRDLEGGAGAVVTCDVDRRLQDDAHQLERGHRGPVGAEGGPNGLGQGDGFGRAGKHPAALGDQLTVVIVPARTGQAEQPLPLCEREGGVGVGIEEYVAVVEGATSLMASDSSMPLPNTSPDMSPIPTAVKGSW